MTTDPTGHPAIPGPAEREARNTALLATGAETGFWDDHGRPAPWPDDIDDWTPETRDPSPANPTNHRSNPAQLERPSTTPPTDPPTINT